MPKPPHFRVLPPSRVRQRVTLAALHAAGVRATMHCVRCRHATPLDLPALAGTRWSNARIDTIETRCGGCGVLRRAIRQRLVLICLHCGGWPWEPPDHPEAA